MNFNERVKQILLILLIFLLVFLSIRELKTFLPGILGAFTLYILSRANYFQLVYNKKWKKGRAAFLFMLYYLLLIGVPIFMAVTLISPKVNQMLNEPHLIIENIKQGVVQIQEKAHVTIISDKSLEGSLDKVVAFIPTLLNSTLNLITNLITMLFF